MVCPTDKCLFTATVCAPVPTAACGGKNTQINHTYISYDIASAQTLVEKRNKNNWTNSEFRHRFGHFISTGEIYSDAVVGHICGSQDILARAANNVGRGAMTEINRS